MRIEPGQVLHERWQIEHVLGEGGMGYVLAGRDALLERKVAIKSLHPHLAAVQQIHDRFLTEARVMARIDVPQVVSVYDAFDWQGLPVVIMEYVDGEPLSALLERVAKPPPSVARSIAEHMLRGLRAAHREKVVHRDVKPDNIMVVRDDEGEIGIRLLDFGVAQVQQELRHTRTGAVVGTVRYMSPEQVRDASRVDARTDLFSAGLVLWEMLSGGKPWADRSDDLELRIAVVREELPPLPRHVPADLRALVEALTRKDPAERPESAGAALRHFLQGEKSAGGSGPIPPPIPPPPVYTPLSARKAAEVLVSQLVPIAANTFEMGTPGLGWFTLLVSDEKPAAVALHNDFAIGKYPVTQEQYAAVMGVMPPHAELGAADSPVVGMSWLDAIRFTNRVNVLLGLPPVFDISGTLLNGHSVYRNEGLRLPTEAEWEYAARAGTTAERYGPIDDIAWYAGSGVRWAQPVGRKQPNAAGLHDMLGNAWEWVFDAHGADLPGGVNPAVIGRDPMAPRVRRGGSWECAAADVRAARRQRGEGAVAHYDTGFRIARTLKP